MSLYPLQAQSFSLAGSGASIGDTVLNLKSFKDINGTTITMADLGTISYITIEPGSGSQEEQISFTGVTQNADGSAQLTGVKTVLFKTPYTETSGMAKTHAGSVIAVLSNTSAYYNQFGILSNDETITGNWNVPTGTPVAAGGITSKAYVLSVVNGGTVTTDQVIVAGSAGENLTAGNVAYLKSDGTWYKASSATAATCLNVQLGIVQGTVTTGAACSILVSGMDKTQSGLVAGTAYYLGTAGALSTTAGTISISIGEGITSANLQFKPGYTTGGATASVIASAGMIPIAASGSARLDTSWVPVKFGGTGEDGALTITSGTTTINCLNAAVVVKNYSSISITGTGQLAFSNPNTNGTSIVLKSSGGITITSSANPVISGVSIGATASTEGYGFSLLKTNNATDAAAYNSPGSGGALPVIAPATLVINELSGKYPFITPGSGGSSGARSGGGGGASVKAAGSNGNNGANAGDSGSGTGGRGGAVIVLECAGSLNYTSATGISVNGGVGAAGTGANGGGGGGGGGGVVLALYNSVTATSGTITVAGGLGGAGSGTGGAGGVGGAGYYLMTKNTEFF